MELNTAVIYGSVRGERRQGIKAARFDAQASPALGIPRSSMRDVDPTGSVGPALGATVTSAYKHKHLP